MTFLDWLFIIFGGIFILINIGCTIYCVTNLFRKKD